MGRILYFIPLLLIVGFLGAVALPKLIENAENPGDVNALPSTLEGKPAPTLELQPLQDLPLLTDAALRAPEVKLVNFWASWCAPCRAEHPTLIKLQSEGLTILGVNYKDKPENARGFLAELGNPYAAIGADSGRLGIEWGVYGVPETFVIDAKGQIILRHAGPITEQELERVIRPAIAKARGE
jgi:cytochrome c biogenesis protein CcmG/thiol:disulfide interchange protein DsbE